MSITTLNMTTLDGGVIIKKGTAPAPPSGEESWRYFRCTAPSAYNTYFIGVYSIVRVENPQLPHAIFLDSGLFWVMAQQDDTAFDSATAMAINMGMRVTDMTTIELSTVGELYGEVINKMMTAGELTEITKEQFYSLD